MKYEYAPKQVCSRKIEIELSEDGIIQEVTFIGGCKGNTSGISKLVAGMSAREVIDRLRGTDCGGKGTSCPDQLSVALERALAAKA